MAQKVFDREVEEEALIFVQSLSKDMNPEEIIALFDQLEKQHAIVETKLMLTRTIFMDVLNKKFEEDRKALPQGLDHLFG